MTGYRIKFSGIDRLFSAYSWRLTRRAKAAWKSGQVLEGQYLNQLETQIAKKYGREYAVGVGSATDGLYFAMKALGLNKDSSVMCPVLSYAATSGAIHRLGANIQFVDTDNMGLIGDLQYKKTPDAVLYVNLYGNCVDYDRLLTYCRNNGIPLIEDAAQSQGAVYNRVPSGAMGDISVFSFDPMKNMPCFGNGGMVLTDSKDHYEKLKKLRKGRPERKYKSVLSEDHCNQLLLLLDKFNKLQKMRRAIYKRYKSNLPDIHFLVDEKGNPSYHKLVLLTDERNELKKYLEDCGIETKIHYDQILDQKRAGLYTYPYAEDICKKALSLPIYPYLNMDEVDYVCERIKKFYDIKKF